MFLLREVYNENVVSVSGTCALRCSLARVILMPRDSLVHEGALPSPS